MRQTRVPDLSNPVTPGWIDSLPAGGLIRMDPSVRTAAELVGASDTPDLRQAQSAA